MNTHLWLLKREYWEHRGGFLRAPLIASGIFLFINLMAIITGEVFSRRAGISINGEQMDMITRQLQSNGANVGAVLDMAMYSAASIAGVVLIFVVFFYCLGALYDDRRDRSVLLWKSLPISDRDTVLSKLASAGLVAPVVAVLVGIVCALVMLLMTAVAASLHGLPAWQLLAQSNPFRVMFTLLALIPVNLVWALPTLGWLLLVSAWARSKPFLWAVGIPVGAGILLTWFNLLSSMGMPSGWFWEHIVGRALLGAVPMGWLGHAADMFRDVRDPQELLDTLTVTSAYAQLVRPEFWLGAIAGAAMIAAAIWMRGKRTEV